MGTVARGAGTLLPAVLCGVLCTALMHGMFGSEEPCARGDTKEGAKEEEEEEEAEEESMILSLLPSTG